MPATTIETRAKIVTLWERDLSYRQVAAEVGVSEHTQEDEEWEHEDLIPLSERRDSLQEINHFTEVRNTKYKWTKEDLDNSRFDVEWPTFSSVSKKVSPVLLLENFIDEEIIEMFVSCTNNYAASKHRKADVTAEEFKVFLRILLLSGYVSVPRHRMFSGNYKDSHNNMVFESMSRNRFEHILTNVHCCDNNNLDKKGRFPKVRPFFTKLRETIEIWVQIVDWAYR
ncbi:transposase is4 [Holotrichia oblita]|uniref:Transposase is4 n=1 Tax=Holotrichia oblita TaxID=644536 RepID=A0ACB9TE40_HOLOL|nr:transposase is4 [Holotrichia oblita]